MRNLELWALLIISATLIVGGISVLATLQKPANSYDLNQDGVVDMVDASILLANIEQ